jgi:type II secretory pathway predicted ATPase ExeA
MYCDLFQLTEPPFRLTPDPQFLFASKQHARAKAYMESTIWLADGFVVITGDIGSGKTTLIEAFVAELPDDVVLAHISQTQLSPVEFLQALLVEFGFKPFRKRKVELLSMLKDFMVEQYAAGKKILLIIDEAQNLSRKVLEEVRLLSGLELQKEKLLRIIIAGQPELSHKLERLQQLTQRVRLRFHLGALSKRETHEYITHRLDVAGAKGRRIFESTACDLVFRYSGGVPRLVNVLCDTALLCAFAEELTVVDEALVKAAAEELQWVEYAERMRAHERGVDSTGRFVNNDRPMARLEVLHRDQLIGEYRLRPGKTIIGRTADNDVQIQSRFVSRHHAQVVSDQTHSILEDLNSTNGVFIRSQRIKQQTLVDGDIIQIGEHKLLYRDMRNEAAEAQRREDAHEDDDLDADDEDDDDDFDDEEDDGDDDGGGDGLEEQLDEREG